MTDEQNIVCVSMLVYAAADVIGSRLKGEKTDPKELAERASAFGKCMQKMVEDAEAQATSG